MADEEEGVGAFIFIVLICIGFWWWHNQQATDSTSALGSYSSSPSYKDDCSQLEPNNPYNTGSGHYAGFDWGEENDPSSCNGNSSSFIEGCEEYISEEEAYQNCLNE